MPDEIRSFLKGINKDAAPISQPKDTYRDAHNFVQISEEGNVYALTNEKGSVLLTTSFPGGFNVIGFTILNTDVIIALAHPFGYSQFGIISPDGSYKRHLPAFNEGAAGDTNSELGLQISLPVDMIARKRLAGERIVYFCDGALGRPMGRVNLDNPPPIGDISDNSKVIPNQSLTQIDLIEVEEISGNLRVGMYHFATRYYTSDLTPTTIGIPSNGIPVVEDTKAEGRDKFDGEYPDYGAVNKSISLQISNIDQSYPFMALVVIRYEGITNTITIEEQPIINITSPTMFASYSGQETSVKKITQEELQQQPISYSTAKAVTQKDNIAFWSNLTDNSNAFDGELQRIANDVSIEYVIKEVDYAPSGEISVEDEFGMLSLPYTAVDPTDDIVKYIVLKFNHPVNFPISSNRLNYTFYDRGQNAYGKFTITVPTDLATDTFTVGPVTFVAKAGPPTLPEEFDVSSGNTITIITNLNTAINSHPSLTGIVSSGSNGIDSVSVIALVAGTAGNSITLTYMNNAGVAGATVVPMAGGINSVAYTPTVVIPDPNDDPNTIYLQFDDTLFGGLGAGIPGGGTLDITDVESNLNSTYSATGLSVTASSTAAASDRATALGEFTDYKNESMTFYFKGYRRQEVYSFGLIANFKDGAPSFNYHIPGNDKTTLITTEAVRDPSFSDSDRPTFGRLGTYVSNTDYPTNQNYPGTQVGDDILCYDAVLNTQVTPVNRQIRHHKMPNLQVEPHFRVDPLTGRTKIRILGVRFTFHTPISPALQKVIQSITLTRERRNTAQNRSIFAQGVVTRYINLYREFPYRWFFDGGEDPSLPAWRKMPFFNNTFILNDSVQRGRSSSLISIGSAGQAPSISYKVGNDAAIDDHTTGASNKRMAFFSPDTQLGSFNPSFAEGAKLVPQMAMVGTPIKGGQMKPSDNQKESLGSVITGETTTIRLRRYILVWMIVDYATTLPVQNGGSADPASNPTIVDARFIPKGAEVQLADLDDKIDNTVSSRHLYIRTDSPPTFGINYGAKQVVKFHAEMTGETNWFFNDSEFSNSDSFDAGQVRNHLFSMITQNTNQYGTVSGSTYIPLVTTRNLPTFAGAIPEQEVYGGDTFISKFAYRNVDVIPYRGMLSNTTGNNLLGLNTNNGYSNDGAIQHDSSPYGGMNFKAIGFFFVESGVNAEYRHQYVDRSDPNNQIPEVPYFPKITGRLALQQQAQEGDTQGYNLQYSFENDSKTFANKLAAQITVGVFENRTIYSQKALEDEKLDSYQIYTQNSFYDMPKHTGPIWDNFVYANTLYLHTPKSLWRTYVNDVVQQANSNGETVMGTGGLFAIPAKEVIVSSGGYAGSISQWAGISTPFGYMFPDVLQGKIFMLQGEQLREISNIGMQQYFHENLDKGLTNNTVYIDNPYTGSGIMGAFDYELRRYILVKRGTIKDFTWSFSALTEAWISEHDYSPSILYAQNRRLYAITNPPFGTAQHHQHNMGPYANFYGNRQTSSMTVVFNEGAGIEKVWDNMMHHTKSQDELGVVKLMDTWDTIQMNTDTRNTGTYEVIPTNAYGIGAVDSPAKQVRAKRVQNKFALSIPADAVIDESLDIFDPTNLDTARPFKPRMKGDHITIHMVYENKDNLKFIVNFISCQFRANAS